MAILPFIVIFCSIASLSLLASLHFLSKEFHPSWRMISEYALGKYPNILSGFFISWGIANIGTAIWMLEQTTNLLSKTGVLLLVISGLGAIMGGLFDIKHKFHGLSFMLGIPTLLVGSLFISYDMINQMPWLEYRMIIMIATHSIWISCVIMAITMNIMFAGFKKSGIDFGPETIPPAEVPDGVIAWAGYANRWLVICYITWVIIYNLIKIQN